MSSGSTGTQALAAQVKPLYGAVPKGKGKGKPFSSQNKKPKAQKKTSSRRR